MVRIRKSYKMEPTPDTKHAVGDGGVVAVTSRAVPAQGPGKGEQMTSSSVPESQVPGSAWPDGEDPTDDTRSEDPVAERAPLLYCSMIVRFPKTLFGLTLSGHLLMLGVSIVLLAMGKDVFPAEFKRIPFELTGQMVTRKYWAWLYRQDNNYVIRRLTWNIKPWNRGTSGVPLELIYSRSGGNLFEKPILQQIQAMEDRILSEGEYRKNLCQLTKDLNNCVQPNSVLRYFDGSMVDVSAVFNDTGFDNISGVVREASQNPQTKDNFDYLLGSKTEITRDLVYTDYLRTQLKIGFPIANVDDWSGFVGSSLFEKVEPEVQKFKADLAPDLEVTPFNWNMFVAGAGVYGIHDVFLVLGSVIFIFLYMWFSTGSFFVTYWAVFSIVTSFFGTNLIYRYILDFRYFSYFHLIAMFIILGIGADDIFVFFNTWKASGLENHRTNEIRLSEVYRRAAVSMFVTSFTTMVAFFVTSMTPMIPARSFGIFTGVMVIINYISVVVFLPTVIYIYHLYLEDKYACLPQRDVVLQVCCKRDSATEPEEAPDRKKKPTLLVQFFSGPYHSFITHPVWRWILLLFFAVIAVFFIWSTSTLRPDAEQVMIFKENTPLGRGWKLVFSAFRPNSVSRLNTNLVWGLRPRDTSHCHFSDYKCRGVPVFDDNFDINIPEVQIAMRDFCRMLKYNLTETELNALNIRKDDRGQADVECFMDNLERFLQAEERYLKYVCNAPLDLSFPLTELKVRPFMECLPVFYNTSKLPTTFHRYFEVVMSYWLTSRYTMYPTNDFKTFNSLLGEALDGPNTHTVEFWNNINKTIGWNITLPGNISSVPKDLRPVYGTKLRFAAIPVKLSSNFFGMGYTEGLPIHDKWEEILKDNVPKLPHGMQLVMQANDGQWHWLFVQQTLVSSALTGVALGIGLALPVLILATQNFLIGTIATTIITITCACIVGVIPLAGWKLGMLVSINLCLVVGLSIDYIVHMAEAYHMSEHPGRKDKVRDMLGSLGSSVVAGGVTTLGASFFMFFGKTQFFLQFAAFMFSTTCFSVLFALGLFPVVMALCGPTGQTGSILPVWRAIKNCFTGRKRSDVDCDTCNGRGYLPPGETDSRANNLEEDRETGAASASAWGTGAACASLGGGAADTTEGVTRRDLQETPVLSYVNASFYPDEPSPSTVPPVTLLPLLDVLDLSRSQQQQQEGIAYTISNQQCPIDMPEPIQPIKVSEITDANSNPKAT